MAGDGEADGLAGGLDALEDLVFALDPDGRHTAARGRLRGCALVGRDLIGRSQAEAFGAVAAEAHRAGNQAALAGQPAIYDWIADGADGPRLLQTSVARRLGEDGAAVGLVGVTRDVTAARGAEAAALVVDRLDALAGLTSSLAHEINNALASVMANLDAALAQASQGPGPIGETLVEARDAADRVRRIVRDLRVFARSDREPLHAMDLEEVIETALRLARHQLALRSRVARSYGRPPAVKASLARLGHALVYLLGWAGEQGGDLHLTTTQRGDEVVLAIDVDGAALGTDIERRLLSALPHDGAGRGDVIGLMTTRSLVESLGGRVEIEAGDGGRVLVRVVLPAANNSEI